MMGARLYWCADDDVADAALAGPGPFKGARLFVLAADYDRDVAEAETRAGELAAAVTLLLFDAHPTYANTTGWRGGIGGQAITQGCSIIDPPPGDEWAQYELLLAPVRRFLDTHPGFDLVAAKERLKQEALDALRKPEVEG